MSVNLDKRMWELPARLALISLGCLCFAAGVALFLDPLQIAPGGVSGVAIVLGSFLPIETGTILLALNIPLLILGLKKFGKEFLFTTVYATILLSVFMDLIAWLARPFPLITHQELLASIVGSGCTAIGSALVFRCGGTTGGVDIVVKILRTKYPHIKSGALMMTLDTAVMVMVAVAYRDLEKVLIAGAGIIVYGVVLDRVLYSADEAAMMLIVSKNNKTIAKRILEEVGIGATFMPAVGAYTGRDQEILLCVAHKPVYPKVGQIVREEDPAAFTIITNANEVYGEGFKNPFTTEM